jgi:hypothetical protein
MSPMDAQVAELTVRLTSSREEEKRLTDQLNDVTQRFISSQASLTNVSGNEVHHHVAFATLNAEYVDLIRRSTVSLNDALAAIEYVAKPTYLLCPMHQNLFINEIGKHQWQYQVY